eukprot:10687916-Lingulodinium_polyedra.AAC.1
MLVGCQPAVANGPRCPTNLGFAPSTTARAGSWPERKTGSSLEQPERAQRRRNNRVVQLCATPL